MAAIGSPPRPATSQYGQALPQSFAVARRTPRRGRPSRAASVRTGSSSRARSRRVSGSRPARKSRLARWSRCPAARVERSRAPRYEASAKLSKPARRVVPWREPISVYYPTSELRSPLGARICPGERSWPGRSTELGVAISSTSGQPASDQVTVDGVALERHRDRS
jgi:hypothetical protein